MGLFAAFLLTVDPRSVSARVAAPQANPQKRSEYEVKAASIHHFVTRYVKWPEATFKEKDAAFVVAVLGKDPFGKLLAEALKDKVVGEHPIKLVNFESLEKLEACQLLYVPATSEKLLPKVREFCAGKPIMLVVESIAELERGAQIGLPIENSKMRIAINLAAVKRAKLELSSELLKLAKLVEDKPEKSE